MVFEIIQGFFEVMQVVTVVEGPRVAFSLVKELFEPRQEIQATDPRPTFDMLGKFYRHNSISINSASRARASVLLGRPLRCTISSIGLSLYYLVFPTTGRRRVNVSKKVNPVLDV